FLVTLLVVLVGAGVHLGMSVYRQELTIRKIEGMGGRVGGALGGPDWLRRLVGDEWMRLLRDERTSVQLDWTDADDATLLYLSAFPDIESVNLNHTEVTDAGLRHLSSLRNLRYLHLENTWVTDAGLRHLYGLKSLQFVQVDPRVSKRGMEELERA